MARVAVKYGLISGPFFLLIIFWTYMIGQNPFNPGMWLVNLAVFGLFMFFAGYEFKNYHFGGIFHFWQGMSIGAIVIFCSTLVFGIGFFVWLSFDPSLKDLYVDRAMETLNANKDMLETISEKDVRNRSSLGLTFQMAVQNNFLSGFVMAPIVALILRKKPN